VATIKGPKIQKNAELASNPLKRQFFLNGHTTKTPAEGKSTTGCIYNLDLLMMGL
jgi:hypothetical protein